MAGVLFDFAFVLAALLALVLAVWWHGTGARVRSRRALLALVALAAVSVPLYAHDLAMQKLPGYLLMPTGLMWLALLAIAVHLYARGDRAHAAAVLAVFAVLSVAGNPLVSSRLMRALEDDLPDLALDEGPVLDAVLVLGAGASFRADGQPQLTDQGDRVGLAARLAKHGRTRVLVASGSTIPGFEAVQDLAAATEALWIDWGVPRDMIRLSSAPKNTSEEVAAFQAMAKREGWTKLGVLSSAWHLPRILRLCRRLGLEVTPIPADHRGGHAVWHPALFVPQASALRTLQLATWELAGMLVGR